MKQHTYMLLTQWSHDKFPKLFQQTDTFLSNISKPIRFIGNFSKQIHFLCNFNKQINVSKQRQFLNKFIRMTQVNNLSNRILYFHFQLKQLCCKIHQTHSLYFFNRLFLAIETKHLKFIQQLQQTSKTIYLVISIKNTQFSNFTSHTTFF